MNSFDPFRIILVIGLVLVLSIGVYYRLRSQASGEQLDRRQEGLFILVSLRLSGLVFAVGLFCWLIEPAWMSWSSLELPTWLRWAGVGFMAFTAVLLLWTFRHLGRNLTDTVVTRQQHTLVLTGPYRWVRHPFYVSAFFGSLGISLLTANWFLFVVGELVFLLLHRRTGIEEAKLVERFGAAYQHYMERTGRFIPRFWS